MSDKGYDKFVGEPGDFQLLSDEEAAEYEPYPDEEQPDDEQPADRPGDGKAKPAK